MSRTTIKTRDGHGLMGSKVMYLCAVLALGMGTYVHASSCTVSPSTPASGHPVTVIYDPSGGPLAGAGTVIVHKGINNWQAGTVDDLSMSLSNGLWYATYLVPQRAEQLDYAFHNGSGTWDNNGGSDWHFSVPLPSVGAPPPMPSNGSGANVMMQGFYWDVPAGGTWYNTMSANAANLRYMRGGYGIDRIWFPAPQKSGGGLSMGYDPYDYYDLGEYNQNSTTETRFGSRTELKNTLAAFKNLGVVSMADIVLNHRSGGASESNPNSGGTSFTDFSGVASGQATWNYNQFHPSTYEDYDEGVFESFPDICHVAGYTAGSAYYDLIEWGNWLTNTANAGFDGGWRFDYPKGVHPSYVADFRKGTGDAFGILEYWDGNISLIEDYVKYSGNSSAFDFPAFYTMVDVFNNNQHIGRLIDSSRVYAAKDPTKAVTFVANHDTDKDVDVEDIADKMLAYAYILTYQGYPCIFWKDYYDYGLADFGGQTGNGIDPLVWVRGFLGGGQPDIQLLKTDSSDLLIYGTMTGSSSAPGYIVVINNHDTSPLSATVTTANTYLRDKTLSCHAWYSYAAGQNAQPADVACNSAGTVTVQAPARGYAVYSVDMSLPGPWTATDVGSVDLEGSAMYLEETYTITGSGVGIEGNTDGFHFMNQSPSGNFVIQARILSLENTNPAAKAGVMIRQGTGDSARNVAVLVTPENGVSLQWRTSIAGNTSSATVGGVTAPCWVRLERSGSTYRGYYSENGTTWTQIGGNKTITMIGILKAGVAATSRDNSKVTTCTMDNISVNMAPELSPVSDPSLLAGEILTVTNSASDADVPAQTLTYSLVNPPVGVSINATNGMLTWRPAIDQSPSTQSVTVAVSDDGIPSLSDTESFDVTVIEPAQPILDGTVITNDLLGFWIGGDTGPDYTVLQTTNLTSNVWLPVYTTNSPALPFFWSSSTTGSVHEFFKVELGP